MKTLKSLLSALAISLLLVSCGEQKEDKAPINLNYSNNKITMSINDSNDYILDFHTKKQYQYLNGDHYKDIAEYGQGNEELSRPISVEIKLNDLKTQVSNFKHCYIQTSFADTFTDYKQYQTSDDSFFMKNFYSNKDHYFRVKVVGSETKMTPISKITTKEGLRNIEVEGVTNVRDIGGFTTIDGKLVNQGLIYRGARMNENGKSTVQLIITEKGIETLHDIGVKSELDLRMTYRGNETGCPSTGPFDEEFQYFDCQMDYDLDYFNDDINKKAIKDIFTLLAVKDNYPYYIHCSIGTDRTGLISFLIEGLLGASLKTLYTDYLFSNLANINGPRTESAIAGYIKKMNLYYANPTLAENIEQFLTDKIGVAKEQISTIKEILIAK